MRLLCILSLDYESTQLPCLGCRCCGAGLGAMETITPNETKPSLVFLAGLTSHHCSKNHGHPSLPPLLSSHLIGTSPLHLGLPERVSVGWDAQRSPEFYSDITLSFLTQTPSADYREFSVHGGSFLSFYRQQFCCL